MRVAGLVVAGRADLQDGKYVSGRMIRVTTTAGTIVCARCSVANSLSARVKGLLGRCELAGDEGMLLTRTGSIHMFFMRFAIDAVFCDRDLRVLTVVRSLRPWRTASVRGARVVIELAEGRAAAIAPGDRLALD